MSATSLSKAQQRTPILRKTKPASQTAVTLNQASRQLGYAEDDQNLQSLIDQATANAETLCDRTIADSVTWEMQVNDWDSVVQFPYSPLLSVESVKYWTLTGCSKRSTPASYYVYTSTNEPGRLHYTPDWLAPSTDGRLMGIMYTFQAGWGSQELIDPQCIQLVLAILSQMDDREDPRYQQVAAKRIEQLAINCSPGSTDESWQAQAYDHATAPRIRGKRFRAW